MQNTSSDDFSFKGIAPDDRAEVDEPKAPLPKVQPVDPLAADAPSAPLQAAAAQHAPLRSIGEDEHVPLQAMAGSGPGRAEALGAAAAQFGAAETPLGAAETRGAAVPPNAQAQPAPGEPRGPLPSMHPSPDPSDPVAANPPLEAHLPGGDAPPAPSAEDSAPAPSGPRKPKVEIQYEGDAPRAASSQLSPRHLVQKWLADMVKAQASDLILRSGGRPSQRLDGRISFLPGQVPGPGPMLEVLSGILGEKRMRTFEETGAADAALDLDGLGRFRINAYKQMGEPAIVIRRINEDAPSLDDLSLPAEDLKHLALRKRGLVLVTGVAGSGKSTTLSAMIEFMNRNVERHVVTLEDPVELLFKERYCVISQREVGTDTTSFKQGLKHALRQSPDVILIGEMRDAETVIAALEAIETGHLVMSTMHTVNASQTVDRILGFFPAERHVQIRQRMADTLAGVLSMRLVPRVGGGLVPAYELMQVTPQVRELLEEGKTTELGRVIQTGNEAGIVAFNDRLLELVQTGIVDMDDAVANSDRPDELLMRVRGIQGGSRAQAKAADAPGGGAPQPTPQRRRSDAAAAPADGQAPPPPPAADGGGSTLRLRSSDY
ncbi:MAG: PilT/PilU family type 4a pilus ATPase [Planctomycetota bacterium]